MALRNRDLRPVTLILAAFLLLLALAAALSGCGGDEETTTTTTTASQAAPVEAGRVIDQAAVAAMQPGEFQQVAGEATDRLIARHGGDEGAFYATLLALDQGYDVYQLLTGSLNDRLQAEGLITTVDGSTLPPARQPQGLFQATAIEPILVACLSGALLAVAEPPGPGDAVIDVGGAALEARELFEAIIARKRQPVEGEQDDDPSPESLFGARVTFASTLLAARGYSVTQIVQGLILDAVRFSDADTPFGDVDPQHPEEGLDYYCAYIQHTSGVMLKPEYPPVDVIQELVCDSAPESAPTLFVDKEIKAAVEGGKSGEAAPGGATPGGVTPGAPGGQTSPAAGESGPPDVGLLNGTWKGTTKTTKASVEGMDISEMQTEGCDPTDIYRVTHKITVELDLKPDGSGTITWTGDSVGLESSGLVESLPGGTASVDWTWGDGRLQIAAAPETGGTLVLDATLETPADETIVLDGTWNGTGTEVLDEEELDLVGSGTFTLTKQVEQ